MYEYCAKFLLAILKLYIFYHLKYAKIVPDLLPACLILTNVDSKSW